MSKLELMGYYACATCICNVGVGHGHVWIELCRPIQGCVDGVVSANFSNDFQMMIPFQVSDCGITSKLTLYLNAVHCKFYELK